MSRRGDRELMQDMCRTNGVRDVVDGSQPGALLDSEGLVRPEIDVFSRHLRLRDPRGRRKRAGYHRHQARGRALLLGVFAGERSGGHPGRVLFAWRWLMRRRCCGLRYASQPEMRRGRAVRAMFKFVWRLDPSAQINNLPAKPKGMHWRTYERLVHRYEAQDMRWQVETKRRFCGLNLD